MDPTRTLPEGYTLRFKFELPDNRRALWLLQIAGLTAFLAFGALFGGLAAWMRPGLAEAMRAWQILEAVGLLWSVWTLLLLTLAMLVLHEGLHGFFFWWWTRERPHFGFGRGYAYAAAPDWYLPREQYLVVGLAPLVVLSLLGLAVVAVLPLQLVPPVLFVMVLNAGGAVGDLWVVYRVSREEGEVLVRDLGDGFHVFGR